MISRRDFSMMSILGGLSGVNLLDRHESAPAPYPWTVGAVVDEELIKKMILRPGACWRGHPNRPIVRKIVRAGELASYSSPGRCYIQGCYGVEVFENAISAHRLDCFSDYWYGGTIISPQEFDAELKKTTSHIMAGGTIVPWDKKSEDV